MKWYEQNFVNRRDWILDHLELLGLDANETILVLLIDFFNEHNIPVTMEILHKKTGLTMEQVDQSISTLCAKKYLEIRASAKKVRFILNGLFDTDTARSERVLDSSLFDTFETEFGRPLSNMEMTKISDWNRTTDKKLILYALRQASAYQHLSINYIDKILNDWKTEGRTVEMIEGEA
ncbi:MAG: DnaD domain protein [Solobacterium sp.]|nr:DnaD domain protein [Solobacterium sp.]MBQ9825407.1 DnaD domain protein [Solobacterium sp.]